MSSSAASDAQRPRRAFFCVLPSTRRAPQRPSEAPPALVMPKASPPDAKVNGSPQAKRSKTSHNDVPKKIDWHSLEYISGFNNHCATESVPDTLPGAPTPCANSATVTKGLCSTGTTAHASLLKSAPPTKLVAKLRWKRIWALSVPVYGPPAALAPLEFLLTSLLTLSGSTG